MTAVNGRSAIYHSQANPLWKEAILRQQLLDDRNGQKPVIDRIQLLVKELCQKKVIGLSEQWLVWTYLLNKEKKSHDSFKNSINKIYHGRFLSDEDKKKIIAEKKKLVQLVEEANTIIQTKNKKAEVFFPLLSKTVDFKKLYGELLVISQRNPRETEEGTLLHSLEKFALYPTEDNFKVFLQDLDDEYWVAANVKSIVKNNYPQLEALPKFFGIVHNLFAGIKHEQEALYENSCKTVPIAAEILRLQKVDRPPSVPFPTKISDSFLDSLSALQR